MTYEKLRAKIEAKAYDTKLPYPSYGMIGSSMTREQHREVADAWRKDRSRLRKVFAKDLKKYCETELGKKLNDEQLNSIYSYAWENGHSSGYEEVLIYADRILDVVRNFVK